MITHRTFQGERPIVQPLNLDNDQASFALDCYLHSSGLDPLRDNLVIRPGCSGAQSLYRVCGEILCWDNFTTFARSPVIDDQYNRVYWTQCAAPGLMVQQADDMTDNSAGYNLSLLAPPAAAPTVSLDRPGAVDIQFVLTLVDTCNEVPGTAGDPNATPPIPATPATGAVEIAPSPLSNVISYVDGVDGVEVSAYVPLDTCPDGSYRYGRKRIYAVIGGQTYFLEEFPRNQASWVGDPLVVDTGTPVTLSTTGTSTLLTPRAGLLLGGNASDTAFVYTYVTQFGEETAPSPASAVIRYNDGVDCVDVSFPPPPVVVGAPAIETVYLYMAVAGEFYRVAVEDLTALGSPLPNPITVTICPLDDDFITNPDPATGIGLPLLSANYDPAPEELCGLVGLPNGVMAGFTNQGDADKCRESGTVYFSEPYQPHAWPYSRKVGYKVTALVKIPEGLLVLGLADDHMTIFTGSTGQVMRERVLETYQSCIDPRSVIRVRGGAAWSCPDGVAVYGAGQVQVLSAGVISREQWQRLNPHDMVFGRYEERLLIYPQSPEPVDDTVNQRSQWDFTPGMGILYNIARQDFTRLSQGNVSATYIDGRNDTTWLAFGGTLAHFNAGEKMVAHWVSKPHIVPGARVFNSARMEFEAETELQLFRSTNQAVAGRTEEADEMDENTPFWSKAWPDEKPHRIESAGRRWNVRFGLKTTGRERVRALFVASDMRELLKTRAPA